MAPSTAIRWASNAYRTFPLSEPPSTARVSDGSAPSVTATSKVVPSFSTAMFTANPDSKSACGLSCDISLVISSSSGKHDVDGPPSGP